MSRGRSRSSSASCSASAWWYLPRLTSLPNPKIRLRCSTSARPPRQQRWDPGTRSSTRSRSVARRSATSDAATRSPPTSSPSRSSSTPSCPPAPTTRPTGDQRPEHHRHWTEDLGAGAEGMLDNTTSQVKITVHVPEDVPYDYNGVTVTNEAIAEATNALDVTDSADVTINVPLDLETTPPRRSSPLRAGGRGNAGHRHPERHQRLQRHRRHAGDPGPGRPDRDPEPVHLLRLHGLRHGHAAGGRDGHHLRGLRRRRLGDGADASCPGVDPATVEGTRVTFTGAIPAGETGSVDLDLETTEEARPSPTTRSSPTPSSPRSPSTVRTPPARPPPTSPSGPTPSRGRDQGVRPRRGRRRRVQHRHHRRPQHLAVPDRLADDHRAVHRQLPGPVHLRRLHRRHQLPRRRDLRHGRLPALGRGGLVRRRRDPGPAVRWRGVGHVLRASSSRATSSRAPRPPCAFDVDTDADLDPAARPSPSTTRSPSRARTTAPPARTPPTTTSTSTTRSSSPTSTSRSARSQILATPARSSPSPCGAAPPSGPTRRRTRPDRHHRRRRPDRDPGPAGPVEPTRGGTPSTWTRSPRRRSRPTPRSPSTTTTPRRRVGCSPVRSPARRHFSYDVPADVSEVAGGIRFVYDYTGAGDGFPPGTDLEPNFTASLRPADDGRYDPPYNTDPDQPNTLIPNCAQSNASSPSPDVRDLDRGCDDSRDHPDRRRGRRRPDRQGVRHVQLGWRRLGHRPLRRHHPLDAVLVDRRLLRLRDRRDHRRRRPEATTSRTASTTRSTSSGSSRSRPSTTPTCVRPGHLGAAVGRHRVGRGRQRPLPGGLRRHLPGHGPDGRRAGVDARGPADLRREPHPRRPRPGRPRRPPGRLRRRPVHRQRPAADAGVAGPRHPALRRRRRALALERGCTTSPTPGVVRNTVNATGFPADGDPGLRQRPDDVVITDVPITTTTDEGLARRAAGLPSPGTPADQYPRSRLRVTTTNTTPARVDQLQITDPAPGSTADP